MRCEKHPDEPLIEDEYGDSVCGVDGCSTNVPAIVQTRERARTAPVSPQHPAHSKYTPPPLSTPSGANQALRSAAKTDICSSCGTQLQGPEEYNFKKCKSCQWAERKKTKSPKTKGIAR